MSWSVAEVRVRFGAREVLKGASLQGSTGEVLALVGPSGSGKTTLGRVIDGIIVATGQLDLPKRIHRLPQTPLALRRSVKANILLGPKLTGLQLPKGRLVGLLDRFQLTGRSRDWAPAMSPGEIQRMAMIRGLLTDPDLFILDEFTSNLDPANTRLLEEETRTYAQSGGSVLLITHDLHQVGRLADRICFLYEGKVSGPWSQADFAALDDGSQAARFRRGELLVDHGPTST